MSDVSYNHVALRRQMIDIVDDKWREDCLSDDEIELPKEFTLADDLEDDNDLLFPSNDEESWHDLGLDKFTSEPILLMNVNAPLTMNDDAHDSIDQDVGDDQAPAAGATATAPVPISPLV